MAEINDSRIRQFEQALLSLDRFGVKTLLQGQGNEPPTLQEVEGLIVPALERIGTGWEEGRVALSQVYMGGRLCEELMDALLPSSAPGRIDMPRMAIAALEDYHLLGMRLVYSVLHASGFALERYGRQEVGELVDRVTVDRVQILLVSVLMLRSAVLVRELRSRLDAAGCRVKLVVGGAPFRLDPVLWREVGADATADSASGSVAVIRNLAAGMKQ